VLAVAVRATRIEAVFEHVFEVIRSVVGDCAWRLGRGVGCGPCGLQLAGVDNGEPATLLDAGDDEEFARPMLKAALRAHAHGSTAA
jgi:hypothetical protein